MKPVCHLPGRSTLIHLPPYQPRIAYPVVVQLGLRASLQISLDVIDFVTRRIRRKHSTAYMLEPRIHGTVPLAPQFPHCAQTSISIYDNATAANQNCLALPLLLKHIEYWCDRLRTSSSQFSQYFVLNSLRRCDLLAFFKKFLVQTTSSYFRLLSAERSTIFHPVHGEIYWKTNDFWSMHTSTKLVDRLTYFR